jgi:hypothetical protein
MARSAFDRLGAISLGLSPPGVTTGQARTFTVSGRRAHAPIPQCGAVGDEAGRLESVYRRTVTIPDHEPMFTSAFAASGGYVRLRGFSTSDEVT